MDARHFPGCKAAGGEINHRTPFTAEVKNEWSHTSTPPPCLRGVDTVNVNLSIALFKHSCIVTFHAVISELPKALYNGPQPRLRMSHTRVLQFYLATSTHKNSKCSHLVTILFVLLLSALHTEACFVSAEAKLIAETQQRAVYGAVVSIKHYRHSGGNASSHAVGLSVRPYTALTDCVAPSAFQLPQL